MNAESKRQALVELVGALADAVKWSSVAAVEKPGDLPELADSAGTLGDFLEQWAEQEPTDNAELTSIRERLRTAIIEARYLAE